MTGIEKLNLKKKLDAIKDKCNKTKSYKLKRFCTSSPKTELRDKYHYLNKILLVNICNFFNASKKLRKILLIFLIISLLRCLCKYYLQ